MGKTVRLERFTALDHEVAKLQDRAEVAIRLLSDRPPCPLGSVIISKDGSTSVAFDAVQLCDPSGGGIQVFLPAITGEDEGRTVTIKNVTASSNFINIVPVTPSKVDGGSSYTIAAAYGSAVLLATSAGWYVI